MLKCYVWLKRGYFEHLYCCHLSLDSYFKKVKVEQIWLNDLWRWKTVKQNIRLNPWRNGIVLMNAVFYGCIAKVKNNNGMIRYIILYNDTVRRTYARTSWCFSVYAYYHMIFIKRTLYFIMCNIYVLWRRFLAFFFVNCTRYYYFKI